MFGFIMANISELNEAQRRRYEAVYCGICRRIRGQCANLCRLGLSYDMAFLALLLMSLYEPEEQTGPSACMLHPVRPRPWVENPCVDYAADMNVALAYYNCLDDWQDDRSLAARAMAEVLQPHIPRIAAAWPRQCRAMEDCIAQLSRLERENCPNPDETANCFGRLMAELLVWREDRWGDDLRQVGFSLGRFIYLADAAVDYRRDLRKKKYNPFLAMGMEADEQQWEQYLVLAMGRCTQGYERLPLVQDKGLLDHILYSGVWVKYRAGQRKSQEENHE